MTLKKLKVTMIALLGPIAIFTGSVVGAETYTVQQGDTLSALALKFNTSVETLVSLNGIQNANFIQTGQRLEISDAISKATTEGVTSPESTATETPVSTTPVSTVTDSTEAAAKEEIARRESGGSYTAQNGQYYGRYQLTNTYLNGDYSPENQERVADAYVAGRYGSWSAALAFWNTNGWY